MNGSKVEEFILKGFSGGPVLRITMSVSLLLALLVTYIGNLLIINIICYDCHLRSPMYFFLAFLSCMEICVVSSVVCKLLAILIANSSTISKCGCFAQSYFYFFTTSSDFFLLSVMSFDRYVAICYPLRYSSIMRNRVCILLVLGCWVMSFILLLYPTVVIPRMGFCGHILDHFFCESAAMLKLVCTDTSIIKLYTIISSSFALFVPLSFTAISYLFIVYTVIKIPSNTSRQKTISTCVSHITMVSIAFGSAIFIEIRPPRDYLVENDKVVNLVSTVLSPLLNPFVYTLRNQKVKDSIRDFLKRNRLTS